MNIINHEGEPYLLWRQFAKRPRNELNTHFINLRLSAHSKGSGFQASGSAPWFETSLR